MADLVPSQRESQSKHDADCLRRKIEMSMRFVCTCRMSDAEVETARVQNGGDFVLREPEPDARLERAITAGL